MTLAAVGLIFQIQPSFTTAETVYTAVIQTEITQLVICNPTASAATFSLFHREDQNVSYGDSVKLYHEISVGAGETMVIQAASENSGIGMSINDQMGIEVGTADSLVFTAYGVTANIAQRYAEVGAN